MELGVVVLRRKESLGKEFSTGSSQGKLVVVLVLRNWIWDCKG